MKYLLPLLVALTCLLPSTRAVEPSKRLNVLLIVADDQNCALGCYGDPTMKSPNIDRLSSMGTRFDRAYCNYPICNASRTSFLSGRRPETTKVYGNGPDPRTALGPDFQFFPEYFHSLGYFTAGIGKVAHDDFIDSIKWDVVTDPGKGVDPDSDDATPVKKIKPTEEEKRKLKKQRKKEKEKAAADATAAGLPAPPKKEAPEVQVPLKWRATDNRDDQEPDGITSRHVAKLLEEHRDGPFFIAAGFHKPHLSHTAPKAYFDLYPPEQMPVLHEPEGHTKEIPKVALPPKYFPGLSDLQNQTMLAHYYAASSFMDAQVGVVLEAMDRLHLWENTVVIFLGDHGWHLGEHGGFWEKMSIMEESAHAPLIAVAPGQRGRGASPRLVEFVDIFPSLCDLAGVPKPTGLEGFSFAPLLATPQLPWKKAVFCVVSRAGAKDPKLGQSVRSEEFTYNLWFDGSEQLYNHAQDPREYRNLAHDPSYSPTLAEMKSLLSAGYQSALPKRP